MLIFSAIVFQRIFSMFQSDIWNLVPISFHHPVFYIATSLFTLQVIVSVSAIIATLCAEPSVLKLSWAMTVVLLFADFIMIFPLAAHLNSAYMLFAPYYSMMAEELSSNCWFWDYFNHKLHCCPPQLIVQTCLDSNFTKLDGPCVNVSNELECVNPIRHWMQRHIDLASFIIYFILVPLKMLIACAVQGDMRRFFFETEIRKASLDDLESGEEETNVDFPLATAAAPELLPKPMAELAVQHVSTTDTAIGTEKPEKFLKLTPRVEFII
ncbi:unnamed protein product [Caenorhabditis auriculariae]|uniref:Uncharacterized protein n=1 Tax=Caenorhabditis auriculariae TaxID=2777116 RepID=A0A8S1GU76_9PELO|nr:unnamed protein product [Caenorhabditis auriculariae]